MGAEVGSLDELERLPPAFECWAVRAGVERERRAAEWVRCWLRPELWDAKAGHAELVIRAWMLREPGFAELSK